MVSWKFVAMASIVAFSALMESAEGLRFLSWLNRRRYCRRSNADKPVAKRSLFRRLFRRIDGCADALQIAYETKVKITELDYVDIINATGDLQKHPNNYFVEFSHYDGDGCIRKRGKSLRFTTLDIATPEENPDDIAWVSIPFLATGG